MSFVAAKFGTYDESLKEKHMDSMKTCLTKYSDIIKVAKESITKED